MSLLSFRSLSQLHLLDMKGVKNKPLVLALLEDMLPNCVIEGLNEEDEMNPTTTLLSDRLDVMLHDKIFTIDKDS